LGLRVLSLWSRDLRLGVRVWGEGLGFGIWGLGFRV